MAMDTFETSAWLLIGDKRGCDEAETSDMAGGSGIQVVGVGLWFLAPSSISRQTMARIAREGVIRIGYAVEAP